MTVFLNVWLYMIQACIIIDLELKYLQQFSPHNGGNMLLMIPLNIVILNTAWYRHTSGQILYVSETIL
jgi:hypothetical protein